MCKNIYTNFYTDFAHFLHLHILHFGLHLRPREETVNYLLLINFLLLEKIAQIIWSFMPIGLMLLGNAIFFGLMIKDMCHLDEQQRNLHGAHRTPKMDRYMIS